MGPGALLALVVSLAMLPFYAWVFAEARRHIRQSHENQYNPKLRNK